MPSFLAFAFKTSWAMCLAGLLVSVVPVRAGTAADAESTFVHTLNHARGMLAAGQFIEARAIAESLAKASEQHDGPDSPHAADGWELWVDASFSVRHRPDPEVCSRADRVLGYRERTAAGDSSNVIRAMQLAARCAHRSGDLARAIALQRRVIAIQEQAFGAQSYDLSVHLNNLGSMLSDAGQFRDMRATVERALAIRSKLKPADDPAVLLLRNNLAVAYQAAGDQAAALPLFEAVLAGYEKTGGENHPKTGYALNNLAGALAATGDPDRARALFERALASRQASRVSPIEIGETESSLGDLCLAQGDTARARTLFESALAIQDQAVRPDHPYRLQALLGLAAVERSAGSFDAARRRAQAALEAVDHGQGLDHPDAARSLTSIGETDLAAGDLAAARSAFERARDIAIRALGEDHPEIARIHRLLAEALAGFDDDRSVAEALASERITRTYLRHAFQTLPERQALAMRSDGHEAVDAALAGLIARPDASDSSRFAVWDALTRSRGLLLDEMSTRIRLGADPDSLVRRLTAAFVSARQRHVHLLLRGPAGEDPARYQARTTEARDDAEAAEATLARASRSFREELGRSRVGLTEVIAALPRGAALVAYRRLEGRSDSSYAAFVLSAGSRRPRCIPLAGGRLIDSLVFSWRWSVERPSLGEARYRRIAAALERHIWQPVSRVLGRADMVFIVPDGTLGAVNFATLPDSGHSYLVDSGPTFHCLTTERDLVQPLRMAVKPAGPLVAIGGVDYDATHGGRIGVMAASIEGTQTRGSGERPSTCHQLDSLRFAPLLETRREIEELSAIWSVHGGTVQRLTGSDASEDAFRRLAPGGRVLHIATHGFFVPACTTETSSAPFVADLFGSDPLIRSGLAMAGANRRFETREDTDDGVLTAAEVSALDLTRTEWVVLSGCDTGLGTPASLEGVLGLRRSFEIAGAGTIVMSLWNVEDAPTRRWMRALYRAHYDDSRPSAIAVRNAERSLLATQRAGGMGGHPFAWGAFVACGDWR